MIEVNRHIPILAVWPWLSIWETDGDRSWIFDRLERFNSLQVWEPEGERRVASLVREDVVPWLRSWPQQPKMLLRNSLEYGLTYDRDSLCQVTDRTQLAICDVFEAFWQPVWDGVFGGPVAARSRAEYTVLGDSEARDAVVGAEIGTPSWEWLDEIEAAVSVEQLDRAAYVFVFESSASRREPEEERIRRYGRKVKFQGIRALGAARERWRLSPGSSWSVPDSGLIGESGSPISQPVEVFCSLARSEGWQGNQRAVTFEDLARRLSEAGAALGLDPSKTFDDNIGAALLLERENPSPYEPWRTWAVVAQAMLDAQEQNGFLKL